MTTTSDDIRPKAPGTDDHDTGPAPGEPPPGEDALRPSADPPASDPSGPACDADHESVLAARVAELEAALADARRTLESAERTRDLEGRLRDAGAVDLETALLLAERALEAAGEADPAGIVDDLARDKPFLFLSGPASAGAAMAPQAARNVALESARDEAMRGDRRALLRYLRLRRRDD